MALSDYVTITNLTCDGEEQACELAADTRKVEITVSSDSVKLKTEEGGDYRTITPTTPFESESCGWHGATIYFEGDEGVVVSIVEVACHICGKCDYSF